MPVGGARPGAGRPKGSRDGITKAHQATISELARALTPKALAALEHIVEHGETEAARVSAANSILDRAYGKPTQQMDVNANLSGGLSITRRIVDPANEP